MSPIAEKHKNTVEEATEHLISRAENARGLGGADVRPRVEASLQKYLLLEVIQYNTNTAIDNNNDLYPSDPVPIVGYFFHFYESSFFFV